MLSYGSTSVPPYLQYCAGVAQYYYVSTMTYSASSRTEYKYSRTAGSIDEMLMTGSGDDLLFVNVQIHPDVSTYVMVSPGQMQLLL